MPNEIVSYDQQWSAAADDYARSEPLTGGTFLSTRGGQLAFGDQALPGNQMSVVILDSIRENSYYPSKFDPDSPLPPTCYAFGRDNDEMAPHVSMAPRLDYFHPENPTCHGCPMNEWGSADTGRGKACQNRRRLALIPAGYYTPRPGSRDFDLDLFTDKSAFQKAEVAFLRLPVTSTTNFSKYVNQLAASVHRPPYGVVTRIYAEPDPKSQYRLMFEMVELIPDSIAQLIMDRHAAQAALPFQGYTAPEEGTGRGGNMGGFRRPGA